MVHYLKKVKGTSNCVIGVDLDNTIIEYNDTIYKTAIGLGLIPSNIEKSKNIIRDHIRNLPNGEIEWQKIQAIVYGPRIVDAKLIDEVKTFFWLCKKNKILVYIISHKTQYSNLYKSGTNLRESALMWMDKNDLFNSKYGLTRDMVYFESTKDEKINRIISLGCTHFIDDMEEVFSSAAFPRNVEKILYNPLPIAKNHNHKYKTDLRIFNSWGGINNYFFYGNK